MVNIWNIRVKLYLKKLQNLCESNALFAGLMGPDLGSDLFSQINLYNTGPFGISSQSMDWSLTRSSMGGY